MAAKFAPTTAETSLVQAIFAQHDTQKLGILTGDVAVNVFSGANLLPTTLGEIWSIADEDNNGWLSRKGVTIAVRLIGWAQKGEKITQDLVNRPGPLAQINGVAAIAPQNTGMSGMSAPKSPPPPAFPPLTPQERTKFLGLFQKAGPGPDGLLSGNQARDVFLRSKLDNDQLLKIWNLADTQDRGSLDSADFAIAMYFIQGLMSKTITFVPTSLPPGLYQQASGQGGPGAGSVRTHMTGGSNSGQFTPLSGAFPQNRGLQPQYTGQTLQPDHTGRSSSTPVPPALPARPVPSALSHQTNGAAGHWDVTATEKAAADRYFTELDTQGRGYIEGDVAVPFMLKSNLPGEHLARIWDLADLNNNGQLTKDGFAIAMHLIQKKLSGSELPDTLPQSLIPPSMRSTATSAFSSPFSPPAQQQNYQQSEPVRDLLWDDTPPPSATAPRAPQPNIFDKTPVPPSKNSDPFSSGGAARDLLFDDDEPVAAHHTGAPLQDQSAEIGNTQNQLNSTSRSLETAKNERAALEETLANQAAQLASLQTQLSSAKAAFETESKLLATLRERHTNQTTEIQKTREELIRAESDLSALRVEKSEIEVAFLRDKEDARDLHRKMVEAGQQADAIKVEIEKAKKDAKQQKGLLAIAKKQLSTKEAERAKAQKELEEAQAEVASIAKEKDDAEAEAASIAASLASSPQPRATSPDSVMFAASHPLPVSPEPTSPNGSIISKSNNPFDRLSRAGGTPRSQSPFQPMLPSPSAINTSVPEESAANHDPFGFADAFEVKDVKEVTEKPTEDVTPAPEPVAEPVAEPAPAESQSTLSVDEQPPSAGTTEENHDFFTPPTSANQTMTTGSPQFTSLDDVASKFPVIEAEDHKAEAAKDIPAKQSEPAAEHHDTTDLSSQLKELEVEESDSDSDDDEIPLSELQKSKSGESQTKAEPAAPHTNGSAVENKAAAATDNTFDSIFGDAEPAKADNDFANTFFSEPTSVAPATVAPAEADKAEPAGVNAFDEAMGTIPASTGAPTHSFSFDSAFDDNFDFASATKNAPAPASSETTEPKPEAVPKTSLSDFDSAFLPTPAKPAASVNGKAPEPARQTTLFDETFMGLDTNTPSLDLKTSFTPPQPAAPEPNTSNPFPTSSEVKATPTSPVTSTPSILPDSPVAVRPKSPPVRSASPKPRVSSSSSKEVPEKTKEATTRHSKLSNFQIRLPFGKKKKQQQHEPMPSSLAPPVELSARTPTPAVDDDVESVKQLTGMGFSRSQAVEALERNSYDVQRALNSLLGA